MFCVASFQDDLLSIRRDDCSSLSTDEYPLKTRFVLAPLLFRLHGFALIYVILIINNNK